MIGYPHITVYCDGCTTSHESFPLTITALGWDERCLRDEVKKRGWTMAGKNEHFCPECTKHFEAISMPKRRKANHGG